MLRTGSWWIFNQEVQGGAKETNQTHITTESVLPGLPVPPKGHPPQSLFILYLTEPAIFRTVLYSLTCWDFSLLLTSTKAFSDFLLLLLSLLQWLFSPHHGKMFMSPSVLSSAHISSTNLVDVHGFCQYWYANNFESFRVMFLTASDLFHLVVISLKVHTFILISPGACLQQIPSLVISISMTGSSSNHSSQKKNHRSQLESFIQLPPPMAMQNPPESLMAVSSFLLQLWLYKALTACLAN